jgi:hypothetical protein
MAQNLLIVQARRQVFDIPPPRIEVTEHQVLDWVCSGYQALNQGQFPQEVCSNTQYGIRLVAMSALSTYPPTNTTLFFRLFFGSIPRSLFLRVRLNPERRFF